MAKLMYDRLMRLRGIRSLGRHAEVGEHLPPRQVIFSSWKARAARVAVGLGFVGVTLWIALPVVASEHPPPRPAGLFVGLNAGLEGAGALLDLQVYASSCTNPVTVEGRLLPAAHMWGPSHGTSEPGHPTQSEVILAGARLESADLGLGGTVSEGASVEPPSTGPRNVGRFREPILDHNGDSGEGIVENKLSGIVEGHPPEEPDAAGALLTSPQWPSVRLPLHFILEADLAYPVGFNRCYIDVPELFRANQEETSAFLEAEKFTSGPTDSSPDFADRAGQSGEPENQNIAAADVSVSVAGHVPSLSSLGDGKAAKTSVLYQCHSYVEKPKLQPNIESNMVDSVESRSTYNPNVNTNCSGTPVFEAVGVTADITRRLLAAGIFGALAATLIVEALFLGETESRRRRHANAP